jgi:hypothetical protein
MASQGRLNDFFQEVCACVRENKGKIKDRMYYKIA